MKESSAAGSVPKGSIIAIFGSPLLLHEDTSAYVDLMLNLSLDFEPNDYFETIWLREITDLMWEIIRLNRVKTIFIQVAIAKEFDNEMLALVERETGIIRRAEPDDENDKIVKMEMLELLRRPLSRRLSELEKHAAQYPRAYLKYLEICAWAFAQIDRGEISARVQVQEIDTIERINRQIAILERRRNATLREIEHHRVAFPRTIDAVARETSAPMLVKSTRKRA